MPLFIYPLDSRGDSLEVNGGLLSCMHRHMCKDAMDGMPDLCAGQAHPVSPAEQRIAPLQ